MRSGRDYPVTGVQRPTHEHAIAFGMQHFDVATFDMEQVEWQVQLDQNRPRIGDFDRKES